MTFSVVQRRELFGRLRALGVRRGEILTVVLTEAAVLGIVGSALGLLVGIVLGRGLMGLVLQTIRDLYFTLAAGNFALSPLSLLKGGLLGLGASLAAALPPALEAANAPARATLLRSELESRAGRLAGRAVWIGLLFGLAGALVLALATPSLRYSLPLSLGGFFLVLVGFSLLVPRALAISMRTVAAVPRKWRRLHAAIGLFGRMGARAVAASISRTGVAVAALTLAVAVSISIAVMIGSFRTTVQIWLEGALIGDLYVSTPTQVPSRAHLRISPEAVERIRALPGVERINTLRITQIESPGELPELLAQLAAPSQQVEPEAGYDVIGREGLHREIPPDLDPVARIEPFDLVVVLDALEPFPRGDELPQQSGHRTGTKDPGGRLMMERPLREHVRNAERMIEVPVADEEVP